MATLYFRSTGTNWGNAGDWSTAPSPGYAGGSVPLATDDVIFEAASGDCIVNGINRVCKTINFTNYINEIQMTFGITVSGAITFGALMQVNAIGSGGIGSIVTSTITPNGFTWPNSFTFGGTGQIYTLADNMTIGGSMITGNGGTINGTGYKLRCTGITQGNTSQGSSGTLTIELYGSGTWTGTAALGWGFNTIINCVSLTITANRIFGFASTSPTLTYTSGAVSCSGLFLFFNCNLATTGMTFADVRFGGSGVAALPVTLLSNMTVSGFFLIQGNTALTANGYQVDISGNLINNQVSVSSGGTTILNLVGTGSISSIGTVTSWSNPITINSPAGTRTFSGTIPYRGNLTYTAGTIVSTGSTLNLATATLTINAPGFNLATLNLAGNCQFLGTNGFTMANLNCITTAGVVSRWTPSNEYIITTAFNSGQADGVSRITYTSSNNAAVTATFSGTVMNVSAVIYGTISVGDTVFGEGIGTGVTVASFGTGSGGIGSYNLSSSVGVLAVGRTIIASPNTASYPKITLNNGATQSLYYTNAIDVDSTSGQTIWSFSSTLLRAFNWNIGTKPGQTIFTWLR
jgi:hypothetical protein